LNLVSHIANLRKDYPPDHI